MKILNWDIEDLYTDEFWRDLFMMSNLQNHTPIEKPEIGNNIEVDGLWIAMHENIRKLYFHNSIKLFGYWLSCMNKSCLKTAIKMLSTSKSNIDIENFIVNDESYQSVLEYAESLKSTQTQDSIESASFLQYLNEIYHTDTILYIQGNLVFVSGFDKNKVTEAYSHLIQNGYTYKDKLTYDSIHTSTRFDIYIFEEPGNHCNYTSLS